MLEKLYSAVNEAIENEVLTREKSMLNFAKRLGFNNAGSVRNWMRDLGEKKPYFPIWALAWLKHHHPDLDLNAIVSGEAGMVAEPSAAYGLKQQIAAQQEQIETLKELVSTQKKLIEQYESVPVSKSQSKSA